MNEDTSQNKDPNPTRKDIEEEYIVLEEQDTVNSKNTKEPAKQQIPQRQIPPPNAQFANQGMPVGGFRVPPYNANPYQYAPQRKKKFPFTIIIIIIIAVIGFIYFVSDNPTGISRNNFVAEETIASSSSSNKVAVIKVEGMILEGGGSNLLGMSIPSSFELLTNGLLQAENDPNVKAVILAINSPGGGMTASDVLNKRIMDFKKNTNNSKPVIALIKDMAASGGYYIASAADYIVAYPTAMTGSIGVIMQGYNFSGLMEKFGVKDATVTSVPDKDRGSPTREPNPYDREFFQVMLRKMHKRFVDKVFEGRSSALKTQNFTLTRAEVESWADGNIVLADDALTLRMIDSIGYDEDAWSKAMSLANISDCDVVRYYIPKRKFNIMDLAGVKGDIPDINAEDVTKLNDLSNYLKNSSTKVWALWLGGEQGIK